LVVLNGIALSVVNDLREKNPSHVFTFRKKPIDHMPNSGWRRARKKAGLTQVRVHDLRHTRFFDLPTARSELPATGFGIRTKGSESLGVSHSGGHLKCCRFLCDRGFTG